MTPPAGLPVGYGDDPGEAFAFAADRGFDFVELNMDYAFGQRRITETGVAGLADEYGLDIVVHLPYRVDPGSPYDGAREGACRTIEVAVDAAAEVGATKGVFHATSRADPGKWDGDRVREVIYDSVRRIDAHAADRGVEACVENVKGPFFEAGDFPELFERTDAAGCLDTGHAYVAGHDLRDQAALLRAHGDRVSHIHLNETRDDREDEHLPVGLGPLEFGALADAIRDTGWSGTLTHEVVGFDREYVAGSKARFEALLDG